MAGPQVGNVWSFQEEEMEQIMGDAKRVDPRNSNSRAIIQA
jgi:hypothetical protein